MNSLLHVQESDITRLENHQFRPLLNALLRAEARRYDIPSHCLDITDRDNISDDGIDARIEHSLDTPEQSRIPRGLSVWQYKAGKTTARQISVEAQKPGIQDAIVNGGSYCFAVGQSCTVPMQENRQNALDKSFEENRMPPKAYLFTASRIAEWASDYPTIAAELLKFPMHDGFLTFNNWDSLPETRSQVDFQVNEKRQIVLGEIGELLCSPDRGNAIRLVAPDGIGKTRLVFEAIRATNLQHFTFYSVGVESIPSGFFSFIRSRTSIDRVILVVDECEEEEFRNLLRKSQICNDRVTIIAIGSGQLNNTGELEPNVFFFDLDVLDNSQILHIVRQLEPSLDPQLQFYTADVVGGSVKLATAIAESLHHNRGVSTVAQLISLPKIDFVLESLVGNEQEREAMQALSLLRYVGLDGDVQDEGQVIAQFLGLDFRKLKYIANNMQRRGLVIKKGRFCHVTPHILATWFAGDAWEAHGNEIRDNLLPDLPSTSAMYRLFQRLGHIGEKGYAHPIVESLFGLGGDFSNIDAFDSENATRLFYILSNAAPEACMKALVRIFRNVSRERLLEFKSGRRSLIFALERLLQLSETFFDGARILLRLADAENETWGNNATGIWQAIFTLEAGPYPAWERHTLINEALHSESVEIQILGVKALQRALSHRNLMSYGSGNPGGQIPQRWHPATLEEVWKSHRSAFSVLDIALSDPNESIVLEALNVLLSTARLFVRTPMQNEVLDRVEKHLLTIEQETIKKRTIDLLDQILEYEEKSLSEPQKQKIQEWRVTVIGSTYRDRLHRWVGELTWSDRSKVYRDDSRLDLNEVISELAQEGVNNPDYLQPELQWLASPQARQASRFAFELGHFDTQRIIYEELIQLKQVVDNPILLANYLYGQYSRQEHVWVEQILEDWVKNDKKMADVVLFSVLWLGGAEKCVQWIIDLVEKRWLPSEKLQVLWRSDWLKSIPDEPFVRILKLLTDDNQTIHTVIALDLIEGWIKYHPKHSPDTAKFIVSLLERPPTDLSLRSSGSHWYNWQRICVFYIKSFPEEITRAAVGLIDCPADASMGPQDDRLLVLMEALKFVPERVWPIIGEGLLCADNKLFYWPNYYIDYRSGELSTGSLFEEVDISILMSWVEQNKPDAPRILAQFTNVERSPLPQLARELIIRFGHDEDVRSYLHPRNRSMSWWGSLSGRLQSMLDVVNDWVKDGNKAIEEWATEIAEGLEEEINQLQGREDEDDLRW